MTDPRKNFAALRFTHPDFDMGSAEVGLTVSNLGQLSLIDGEQSIRQAIRILLSTIPGERLRRPGYGCELHRLVFSPNDETTHGLAMHYVKQAVTDWEPRVDILKVDASRDDTEHQVMRVTLHYRVRRTQEEESLVFALDLSSPDY